VVVLFFLIGPLRDYLTPVFLSSTLAAEAAL
jgi:multicomponent Na+:H+ antiporter subunit D